MTGCADAIMAAVRREVDQRRQVVEAATDLVEVTISVRFQYGTPVVKAVHWQEERVYRRTSPVAKDARDMVTLDNLSSRSVR